MLDGYDQYSFTAPVRSGHQVSHDVYVRGSQGPTVVIIQELPGIGPETLALANRFSAENYRVVLPHLFGPLGRTSIAGNLLRVFCMRREFSVFAKNQSSPIVDWLRALCGDLKATRGATAVGAIGMCLTGNFAISLMADDNVTAGVASQPSMPFGDQDSLHMSPDEIVAARHRLGQQGPMLAMRFAGDRLCTANKFKAIDETFNQDTERVRMIELPGKAHSVLTLDFVKGGEPAEAALQEVFSYFSKKLSTA